jgi:hypothetical protein
MAAKSNASRLGFLRLVFGNADLTGVGDAGGLRGSASAGFLYLTAHTADPTGGDQLTQEASYPGYTRRAIPRTVAGGFTISESEYRAYFTMGQDVGTCTATPDPAQTIRYFGLGTSASGAGKLLYVLTANPPIVVVAGVRPALKGLDYPDPAQASYVAEA